MRSAVLDKVALTTDSGDSYLFSDDTIPTIVSSLPKLGRGMCRRVYAINDDYVLKVDYSASVDCYGGCATELRTYEAAAHSGQSDILATILAGSEDGGWLIMERVESVGCADEDCGCGNDLSCHDSDTYWALESLGISDLHNANWGVAGDGRTVAIDYAMSSELDDDDDDDSTPYGTQTLRHNDGTTCCHESCEHCYPYGPECNVWAICSHPDRMLTLPIVGRVPLCEHCAPNTGFMRWRHAPGHAQYEPMLPGMALFLVAVRNPNHADLRTSLRHAALLP